MCMNAPPDSLSGGQRNDATSVAKQQTAVAGSGLSEPTFPSPPPQRGEKKVPQPPTSHSFYGDESYG